MAVVVYNNVVIIAYLPVGFMVVVLSFLVLFFNIGLTNELKGLLFYVQVEVMVNNTCGPNNSLFTNCINYLQ